ncbi:MAG: ATP-dependent sacrificial sulfur transferase LarE, partial [Candidatus Thermoplasmatota archaeon]|nr:ATP-dependent sacrificial sulfur transferase LarE [Candidatus Thermoplasmatota archaeon]
AKAREPSTPERTRAKLEATLRPLAEEGVLVAMSAGVDSCTLAYVAHRLLGEAARAVTLLAESTSQEEVDLARAFAQAHDLPHQVVEHSELADPDYVQNDGLRCYHCRKNMGTQLHETREALGLGHVVMGVVPDDYGEHRPGLQAAKEAGIRFPYVEAGITKQEVRELARSLGLEVANRPANACLSSRIAYGLEVTRERLDQVEAAERIVRELAGVGQVRVRHHDELARIEVWPQEREKVLAKAARIEEELCSLGFTYVTLDLLGYRSGSMNRLLDA